MRPNGITKYLQVPYLQLNVVLYKSYLAIDTWEYPPDKSNLEKYLAPYSLLRS